MKFWLYNKFYSKEGIGNMKVLKQLGLIFLLCLAGDLVTDLLPFSIPTGVFCMVILFLIFLSGAAKTESLKETNDFLMENMALFFIPAGVGIVQYYDIMKNTVWQIVVICIVSTFVTFAATAYTVRFVTALQQKYGGHKND